VSSSDLSQRTTSTASGRGSTSGTGAPNETKFCACAHIHKETNRLIASCVLSARSAICLAEATLPTAWWHTERTESATVYYSISPLDPVGPCGEAATAGEATVAGDTSTRNETLAEGDRTFVATVVLTHGQLTYEELKEDQNVLIYIPQASFYPGSKFRVPVKLQAGSDLQRFLMK